MDTISPALQTALNSGTAVIGTPTGGSYRVDTSAPPSVSDLNGPQVLTPAITQTNDPVAFMKSLSDLYATTKTPDQIKAETDYNNSLADYKNLVDQYSGKAADAANFDTQYGVTDNAQQVKDLTAALAQKTGEFNNLIARTETKGIQSGSPGVFWQGEQGAIARQASVEGGSLAAQLQAAQGNLTLATQLSDRALNIKYGGIQDRINATLNFLNINKDAMTSAEQRQAQNVQTYLSRLQANIDTQKQTDKDIQNIMLAAAQNGADANLLSQIHNATTVEDAITIANTALGSVNSQIVEANGRKLLINTKTGQVIKDLGYAPASGNSTIQSSVGFVNSKVESDVRQDAATLLDQVQAGALTLDAAYKKLRLLYSPQEVTDEALKSLLGMSASGDVSSGSDLSQLVPQTQINFSGTSRTSTPSSLLSFGETQNNIQNDAATNLLSKFLFSK